MIAARLVNVAKTAGIKTRVMRIIKAESKSKIDASTAVTLANATYVLCFVTIEKHRICIVVLCDRDTRGADEDRP